MKKNSLSIILLLALLAAISSAYAQSGPPPMQEVEATGQAADADAAFKQAVNDAVRQVVGTLVSAENVINNERVIKDQVLTLSDGFVEKVLNQDKTKLDDGTWQVKLKCIVRKGQLYGRLQEVKVPTVKFEGVSLFADVVSQQTVEKDAAALLVKALLGWNGSFYRAISLSEKPEIIGKNERNVTIRMSCRVTLDRPVYEKQFLGKLTSLLETLAIEKEQNLKPDDFWNLGTHNKLAEKRVKEGNTVFCVDGATEAYVVKTQLLQSIINEAKTRFFRENHTEMRIFAVFRDSADGCLLIREAGRFQAYPIGYNEGSYHSYFFITPKFKNTDKIGGAESFDTMDFSFGAEIPMEYLSKITKIELHAATTLDLNLTLELPTESSGGFLWRPDQGFLWEFLKSMRNRDKSVYPKLPVSTVNCFYLPTLQMADNPSEELKTKK